MSRNARTRALPAALLLALTAGACGGGGDDVADDPGSESSASSGSSTTAPTPSPTNTGPLPPDATKGPDDVDTMTLEGRIALGVEPGCTLLEGGGRMYLLLAGGGDVDVAGLAEGDTVRVTGTPDPETMTTCQQGTPFRVASLEVVS